MITGASSPQLASLKLCHTDCSRSAPWVPQPSRIEKYSTGISSDRPARIPGIMPAANKAGTVALGTSTLYTMKAIDGGIRIAVEPAAAIRLAENSLG